MYFGTCRAFGLSSFQTLIGFVMLSLRLPHIFFARQARFSLPLLVVFLITPVVAFWPQVSEALTNSMRTATGSKLLTIGSFYAICPVLVFFADRRELYVSRSQQLSGILN